MKHGMNAIHGGISVKRAAHGFAARCLGISFALFASLIAFGDTYTSASYVQDGLVVQWDAIDNAGIGLHVPDSPILKNLASTGSRYDLTIMPNGYFKDGNALAVTRCSAMGSEKAPTYKTIEVYYKMTKNNGQMLFYSALGTKRWGVLFSGSGAQGYFAGGTSTPYVNWTFNANAKCSMAGTYGNDNLVKAVYKNGAAYATTTTNVSWGTSASVMMIGDRSVSPSGYGWYGDVYAIRMYNRALTADEIAANNAVDVARFADGARLVNDLYMQSGNVTAKFTAGQAGDSHALRFVWDTAGVDHGVDPEAWPNNEKIADVADNATTHTFALPASIASAGGAYCRAFLTKQDGTVVAVSKKCDTVVMDPTAQMVLTRPTEFFALPDTTNFYSGLISGTGPAIIKGGGTVAFTHANNTYSGGTIVSNAVFRLDADGCAGTAGITGVVNTAHVYMNCANVPNEMRFLASYNTDDASSLPTAYPLDGRRPILAIAPNVTVGGKVTFATNALYNSGTNKDGQPRPRVTFNEEFTCDSGKLLLSLYGTNVFKKLYGSYNEPNDQYSNIGYNSSGQGTAEFHASSNMIRTIGIYNPIVNLKAKDAFPKAILFFKNGNGDWGKFFLFGNDQTFRAVVWPSPTYSARPNPNETASGDCFSSLDAPATVRITGCESNMLTGTKLNTEASANPPTFVNRLALFGKVSLVMDVKPEYTQSGFFQDFSVRKSTTTGSLIISNGDFRVSGTASFPNVPSIYVGAGGRFTCNSTRAKTFESCTNLVVDGEMTFADGMIDPISHTNLHISLGTTACLTLPAGTTLTIPSLKIGGEEVEDGIYGDGGTACPQLANCTIFVEHAKQEATWTGGGGADTSAATAANWGLAELPDFSEGSYLATFATGGTLATFGSDILFKSISLSKSDTGFTFAGPGTFSVRKGVDVATPAIGQTPVYDFRTPLNLIAPQDVTFPSNTTLRLSNGSIFEGSVARNGEGDFVIRGSNVWDQSVIVKDCNVDLVGTITTSGGLDETIPSPAKADIDRENVLYFHMSTQEHGGYTGVKSKKNSTCVISNAVIEKPLWIRTSSVSTRDAFKAAPASTNLFRGYLVTADESNNGILIPANSEVSYEGGAYFWWSFYQGGQGTAYFRNKPFTSVGSDYGYSVWDGGTAVFEVGGNTPRGLSITDNGGTYDFRADDVVGSNCTLRLIGGNVSRQLGSVLHLNSTFQTVGCIKSTASQYSYIDGDGATLFIANKAATNSFIRIPINGNVSLRVDMPGEVALENAASASTGAILVEKGTLRFNQSASWTNATTVAVTGSGRLQIQAASGVVSRPVFGKEAELSLSGSGKITLPNGATVMVKSLTVDGQRRPRGRYSYSTISDASVKAHFDSSSTGTLYVRGEGTMFIVR